MRIFQMSKKELSHLIKFTLPIVAELKEREAFGLPHMKRQPSSCLDSALSPV